MEAMSPSRASRPSAAWAGVVFFVLYIVGAFFAGNSPADTGAADVKDSPSALTAVWHDFYNDSGNRWTIIIGAFIIGLAVIALVIFASELRERLVNAGAPRAGRLAFAASLMFAALTMAGVIVWAWIPAAKEFGNAPVPDGELNYMASVLGYALMLIGGGSAAAFMLVTSGRASVRTRILPAWLGWVGLVAGVVVFFLSPFFIPMALLALWVLISAIVLIRRPTAVS